MTQKGFDDLTPITAAETAAADVILWRDDDAATPVKERSMTRTELQKTIGTAGQTPLRVMVSDAEGNLDTSNVTTTELANIAAVIDTLTSGSSVALDFNGSPSAKLAIGHDVTFTTSNRATAKRKTLTIFGHATNAYGLTWPVGWKNAGGTALPTSIPATAVYRFNLECFGDNESDVVVEWVNGAGVAVSLTPAPAQECSKASSVGFNLGSSVAGGPNLGWLVVTLSASTGTFTASTGNGKVSETLDADGSGRYTALQFLSTRANIASHLTGFTWYPPTSSGIPAVATGSITLTIADVLNSPNWNIGVTSYGADEVQQLDWMNTGVSYSLAYGKFTAGLSPYGTSAPIDASGGTGAVQSALATLMGADAPTVGGTMATTTFTFNAGDLQHVDVNELTITPDTLYIPNDGTQGGSFTWSKTQSGDGVSTPDQYSGTWDNGSAGYVSFDGVACAKGSGGFGTSGSVVVGGVTYSMSDAGSSWTLTATDFIDHGTFGSVSAYIGLPLTPTMSTPTQGNS